MGNTLVIPKTYEDGDILYEADLDNIRNAVTNFINGANLCADNITADYRATIEHPPGSIMPYGGITAPSGWVFCDGAAYDSTDSTYTGLNAVITIRFGDGSGGFGGGGSNDFNVPDLRGQFLRGTDNMGTGAAGANLDPDRATRTANNPGGNTGNNVGSEQAEDYLGHTHDPGTYATDTEPNHNHVSGDYTLAVRNTGPNTSNGSGLDTTVGETDLLNQGSISDAGAHSHAITGASASSGGNETRPANVYTNFLIKL